MERAAPGRAGVRVALVAPKRCHAIERLQAALESRGWRTMRLDNAADLTDGIGPRNKAVVVVYAPQASAAMEVLEKLEERRSSVLVVVIADQVEHGDYYCLMQAGAVEYFELAEDPERILQGVEWAARALAP